MAGDGRTALAAPTAAAPRAAPTGAAPIAGPLVWIAGPLAPIAGTLVWIVPITGGASGAGPTCVSPRGAIIVCSATMVMCDLARACEPSTS